MKARLATANLLADLVNQGYVSGLAIAARDIKAIAHSVTVVNLGSLAKAGAL
jgi:hypothetical protein